MLKVEDAQVEFKGNILDLMAELSLLVESLKSKLKSNPLYSDDLVMFAVKEALRCEGMSTEEMLAEYKSKISKSDIELLESILNKL